MKHFLTTAITLFCACTSVFSQNDFPHFLTGTWKVENKQTYEEWNRNGTNALKGKSYRVKNGENIVNEVLEISQTDSGIIYTAIVHDQNNGKPVQFKLTKTENKYAFDNPKHDFPKHIVYEKISDTEVTITVSDGNQRGYSFKMTKIKAATDEPQTNSNPNYDGALAQKLGADSYGMKNYIFVILKTGTANIEDKTAVNQYFKGHLDNINRLVKENKLVVAGPLAKNEKNYRGIFILNVKTVEEANELLQTDPAIKSGLLDTEVFVWFGSAALPEYLPYSDKIWKENP